MELKKERSKLSCKRRESTDIFEDVCNSELNTNTRPNSTPVRNNKPTEDEDSPYFPCSTQEMIEDVDVLWDWNSPQSKPKSSVQKRSKKRLNLQHSPKVPFRRHPSNNNQQLKQDCHKLIEEIRALQELKAEIAKPDNEESLVLSPREEESFKKDNCDSQFNQEHDYEHNIIEENPQESFEGDVEDPFNDDMDEQLILFSQMVENDIKKCDNGIGIKKLKISGTNQVFSDNQHFRGDSKSRQDSNNDKYQLGNINSFGNLNNKPNAYPGISNNMKTCVSVTSIKPEQITTVQDSEIFNDSFDKVLSQINDEDLDQLTQVVDIKQCINEKITDINKKANIFPRSLSENIIPETSVQIKSRKVEWHRTQSFESYSGDLSAQLSREILQEIERKRLEAKAKRDSKKKLDVFVSSNIAVTDPIMKCSQNEIEKKRIQALEKLEAKRLQDIIEKKKQEALKRREEKRRKNAALVKSSLTTKL